MAYHCTCPEDWQGMDHTSGCKDRAKMLVVDPPEGWKYGFPKPFTFKPSSPNLPGEAYEKEFAQWFIDEGYPKRLVDQGMLAHCRYWPHGVEDRSYEMS